MRTGFTEDHYRTLFDSIDRGFCTIEVLFDDDGTAFDYRFLDVNRAFEQQTGLIDATGRSVREMVPAHEEHWFQIYGQVALTGQPVRFEHAAAALGRWYDVYAFRVADAPARRVAVLFSDITGRKQAEQALHASESRYRALTHATAYSVYRLSADGRHLLEVYGGPAAEYPGTRAPITSWLDEYVHPEDRSSVRKAWLRAVAAGTNYELEHRGRFADGKWGWVLSRAVPVRDDEGRIVEWIGSGSDITRRKEAEEALRRSEANHAAARSDAERANRAKDEFLAMLGHELRNPLAPMLTALQLMRLRGLKSREQDVLERQVRHLARMVDDLLDVSRITRGTIELRKHVIELHDIVARALELAGPLLDQRRNHVDVRVPQQGLVISADHDRMAQVVANLLTNAAKYSEPGSRIVVQGDRIDDRVHLSVQDQGVGIPADMLAHVFDAFVQHGQSVERAGGGLGLGLAIVRSMVAAHGGTVRAESEGLNRGSRFIIELDAAGIMDTSNGVAEAALFESNDAPSHPKVLVVDDNEDAAVMLCAALQQLGYVVESASDGPAALAQVDAFQPATVLLDIGLPLMDGYEVARRLRARHDARPVRIIAVTGYGQAPDRQRALAAGFDEHLVKPIDLHRLQHIIDGRVA
jgi:PAS domain S-box-containing protein